MLQREAEQIDEAKTPGNRGEFQMRFPVNPVNIWQRWKPHHLVRCPLMKHRCIVNLMKQSEATRNGDPKLSPRKCWTAGFGRRCLSLRRTGFWKWPHFGHIWAVQFMFTFLRFLPRNRFGPFWLVARPLEIDDAVWVPSRVHCPSLIVVTCSWDFDEEMAALKVNGFELRGLRGLRLWQTLRSDTAIHSYPQ